MQRMISPELFQSGEAHNYEENFGVTVNYSRSEQGNSESSFKTEVSSNENVEDSLTTYKSKVLHNNIGDQRGNLGSTSAQYCNRRQGTIKPPKLDTLNPTTSSKVGKESCECGCMHAEDEVRRRSTGNSPTSFEEKRYYGNDTSKETGEESGFTRHGKYSLVFDDIYVMEALRCCRYRMRRNALCDPFRLPMPQKTREKLEKENEKRKASVTRKVSQFLTVRLDLNREEDLI